MTKLFLSYSRADELYSERLYRSLSYRGFEIWFDKESLLPGQAWEEVIEKEIAASDFVILMLSKKSVGTRGFFQKELRIALNVLDTIPLGHVYLLPVRVDDCAIPAQLAAIHCVDLFPSWDKSLTKICKAIELQTKVKSRAKEIEADSKSSEQIRLLLVNDQPAIMNFASDLWKSCGITIDYAFDVPQALRSIKQSSYSAVISDLSHFSSAGLVTDRAAFEILEWARDTGKEIKLIISTGDVTEERIQLARDLGAVGICNTLQELNDLLTEVTRQKIDYSLEFAAADYYALNYATESRLKELVGDSRCLAFVSFAHSDGRNFVQQLACDLKKFDVDCWDLSKIVPGLSWENVTTPMIRKADVMLAIVSAGSVRSNYFETDIYDGIAKERDTDREFIIPLVLDDIAVREMPYFLQKRTFIDFRGNYNAALTQLIKAIDRKFCKNND